MLNSRDIDLLRPDVAENCRRWMARCRDAGLAVLVTNTVRDEEYQAWLYAQGRTRPGGIVTNGKVPTFHSVEAGLAFDFCKNRKGQDSLYWVYHHPYIHAYRLCGDANLGSQWGCILIQTGRGMFRSALGGI